MNKKQIKPYWYFIEIHECVVCGATDTIRTRIYDSPKPDDISKRYKHNTMMCDTCKWNP